MPPTDTSQASYEAIDTYNDTVTALLCLGHVLVWEVPKSAPRPNASFRVGRRMDTSAANRVAPNAVVTPDLLAVVRPEYGLVAEAKLSFHGTAEERARDFQQLMKYDDNLTGWPIPGDRVAVSDVALLVHYTRKGDTKALLDDALANKSLIMTRPFAAICFARITQQKETITLEGFYGALADADIWRALQGPLVVPLVKVLPHNPQRLYDGDPPPALLLDLIWSHVFSDLVPESEYEVPGKKTFEVTCTVAQVREEISRRFGFVGDGGRQPDVPRQARVKDALERLVKMKLAQCVDKSTDTYKVWYRRKSDPIRYFVKRCIEIDAKRARAKTRKGSKKAAGNAGGKKAKDAPGQMKLF